MGQCLPPTTQSCVKPPCSGWIGTVPSQSSDLVSAPVLFNKMSELETKKTLFFSFFFLMDSMAVQLMIIGNKYQHMQFLNQIIFYSGVYKCALGLKMTAA